MVSEVLVRGSVGPDEYVWNLQAAYDSGFRLYDPDYALAQDPAATEKMRRDAVVESGLNWRYNAIAGRRWSLAPFSDREDDVAAAAILEDLLRAIKRFAMSRKSLASAIFEGKAAAMAKGDRQSRQPGNETQERDWWAPTELVDKDARDFRYEPLRTGDGIDLSTHRRLQVYNYAEGVRDWVTVSPDLQRRMVWVTYEDRENRLGYGRGLREALFHTYWIKSKLQEEGLQGIERWSQGWTVAKVDMKARGDTGQSEAQVRASFLNMLKKHRARFGGIVIDANDDVQTIFPTTAGNDMVLGWFNLMNDCTTRLLTGSLLPTGGGDTGGGSLARAGEEGDQSEMLVQYDRGVLAEALTESVVQLTWDLNREQMQEAGYGNARRPSLQIVNAHHDDPLLAAQLLKESLGAGLRIIEKEAYERTGWTQPKEDDKTLEPLAPGPEFGGFRRGA